LLRARYGASSLLWRLWLLGRAALRLPRAWTPLALDPGLPASRARPL